MTVGLERGERSLKKSYVPFLRRGSALYFEQIPWCVELPMRVPCCIICRAYILLNASMSVEC